MSPRVKVLSFSALILIVLAGVSFWYVPTKADTQQRKPDSQTNQPNSKDQANSSHTASSLTGPELSSNTQDAAAGFLELRSRAEAGDVAAQRKLGQIYQHCSVFSISHSNMYATLDAYAHLSGKTQGAYDDIKKRFAATCSVVDGGDVILEEHYTKWFERAADHGDPYARIYMASSKWTSLKPGDYQLLARDAVNSADPEAIFALGDLLALAPEGTDLGAFNASATGPYANYAWGIVACRMGADCGAGSFRMDSLCVNSGVCGSENFEDAIRSRVVPAGQQESLDRAIGEVNRAVGKKPS